MRRRRGTLLILLLGIAAAGGSVLAWATCDCAKLPLDAQLARAAVGLAFVLVGAVALNQTGTARVGVLMVIVGLTWFIDDLGWIYHPLPYSFSRLAAAFFQPVLAHLALSFPSGRLNNRLDRAVAISGYVLWFVM